MLLNQKSVFTQGDRVFHRNPGKFTIWFCDVCLDTLYPNSTNFQRKSHPSENISAVKSRNSKRFSRDQRVVVLDTDINMFCLAFSWFFRKEQLNPGLYSKPYPTSLFPEPVWAMTYWHLSETSYWSWTESLWWLTERCLRESTWRSQLPKYIDLSSPLSASAGWKGFVTIIKAQRS